MVSAEHGIACQTSRQGFANPTPDNGVACNCAGSAQSGHYYSLVAERHEGGGDGDAGGSEGRRWVRLDDTHATPFDTSRLEEECFGGTKTRRVRPAVGGVGIGVGETVEEVPIERSAFLLFYERVAGKVDAAKPNLETAASAASSTPAAAVAPAAAAPPPPADDDSDASESSVERQRVALDTLLPDKDFPRAPTLSQSLQTLWDRNTAVVRQQQRFDAELFRFVGATARHHTQVLAKAARRRGSSPLPSKHLRQLQRQCDPFTMTAVKIFVNTMLHSSEASVAMMAGEDLQKLMQW